MSHSNTTVHYRSSAYKETVLFFDCQQHPPWGDTHRFFLTLFTVVILLGGTMGNSIAYHVLRQKGYKNNVMASALRYLAIVDSIILWTVLVRLFFIAAINDDIALSSVQICLFATFYTLAITSCDNWLLVIITLTRLIHLMCPFRTQTICSKFNYYLLVTLMHIIVILIHGGIMVATLVNPHEIDYSKFKSCYSLAVAEERAHLSYRIINVTTNFLVPGALLIIFNIMITRELRKMEEREKMLKSKPIASNRSATGEASLPVKVSFDVSSASELTRTTTDATQNALEYQLNRVTHEYETMPEGGNGQRGGLQDHMLVAVPKADVDARGRSCRENAHQIHTANGGDAVSHHFLHLEKDISSSPSASRKPSAETSREAGERQATPHLCLASAGDKRLTRRSCSESPYLEENISQNASKRDERAGSVGFTDASSAPKSSKTSQSVVSSGTEHRPRKIPKVKVFHDDGGSSSHYPGTASSSTTVKSSGSRSEMKTLSKLTWGSALERVSIAMNKPIELDMESWPSSVHSHRETADRPADRDRDRRESRRHSSLSRPIIPHQDMSVTVSESGHKRGDSRVTSLTRLLMIASAMFLFLNLPYWAFHLVVRQYVTTCVYEQLLRHIVLLLRYANHSLNFYFYCASGSRFRQEFFIWWQDSKWKKILSCIHDFDR